MASRVESKNLIQAARGVRHLESDSQSPTSAQHALNVLGNDRLPTAVFKRPPTSCYSFKLRTRATVAHE
jgi:hypothetical protein